MDLPAVPASVAVVITSGKLPTEFAAFFTAAGELTDGTSWVHVASAVDAYLAAGGVDEDVRGGALALAGAYGHLAQLDDCDPYEMDKVNDRAVELLHEAEAGGVTEEETSELWWYSKHMGSVAAESRDQIEEMDAYAAKHGATPRE